MGDIVLLLISIIVTFKPAVRLYKNSITWGVDLLDAIIRSIVGFFATWMFLSVMVFLFFQLLL